VFVFFFFFFFFFFFVGSRSVEQAMLIQSLCNGSSISQDEKTMRWKYTGDPTEVALLVAAYKLKMSQVELLADGWQIVGRAPFDSNRKRMSVIVVHKEKLPSGSAAMVLSKGAPEATLRACTHIMVASGDVLPVSDELVRAVDHQSGLMADEGLRVLGLAFSLLKESDFARFNAEDDNSIEFEQNLVFCGLAGLLDPPRAPVARAVAVAHGAGIRVVMITGDHPRTALAIAKRLGIALPSMSEKQVLKGKVWGLVFSVFFFFFEPFYF
jgi:Ca2+-transporting ATPase